MYGLLLRDLASSLALALLFSTVAMSAEPQRRSAPASTEDAPLSTAERMTREGLLSGIAGDAKSRDTSLRSALCVAPDYSLARWHLGQVRAGDKWLTLAQVEARMASNSKLEEYRRLCSSALGDPRRELALAGWCRYRGLRDAEQLHLRRVLADDTSGPAERRKAKNRLGLRMYDGELLTKTEIRQSRVQSAQARKDQAKWWRVVEKWGKAIDGGAGRKQRYALEKLRAINDPAAIPALETLLSPESEQLALEVVYVLGKMPEYAATQSLVLHAVDGLWRSVREAGMEQLERRPLHDYAPLLLRGLVAPVQTKINVEVGADGLVRREHEFFREGLYERRVLKDRYVGGPSFISRTIRAGNQTSLNLAARISIEHAIQTYEADELRRSLYFQELIRADQMQLEVADFNAAIYDDNDRRFDVLERTTGESLGRTPAAWWDWWLDYNEVYQEEKPTYTDEIDHVDPYYFPWTNRVLQSCFPAGTKVRSERGLVDIERVRAGDRVLSQDVETGELAYKLVSQTTERPPSDLLRITLGDTTITATKGHPFWVNNVGWRMAKRLKVGQQLHSVGGGQTIDGIEPVAASKAFNLVVSDFGTYFVGKPGVLVRDNTYRKPTTALTPGLLVRHVAPGR